MKTNNHIQDEVTRIAPLLSNIQKPTLELPDKVYFDQLQKKVWSEIEKTTKPIQQESWLSNLRFKVEWLFAPRYALSFAVVFSFMLLSINYYFFLDTKNIVALSSLSDAEIHAFLTYNIDEFDEPSLLNETFTAPSLDKNISAEQIEKYLENDLNTEIL